MKKQILFVSFIVLACTTNLIISSDDEKEYMQEELARYKRNAKNYINNGDFISAAFEYRNAAEVANLNLKDKADCYFQSGKLFALGNNIEAAISKFKASVKIYKKLNLYLEAGLVTLEQINITTTRSIKRYLYQDAHKYFRDFATECYEKYRAM